MTDKLHGWACYGKDEPLKHVELPLKTWDEDDVEIQITDSGICGSDVHTLDSNWGPTLYPAVVGHEIAGIVTKVGQNVKKVKVGDRAGVGPICYACGQCESCLNGKPNVCAKGIITTYNSRYGNGDKTYGGYADIWRGNKLFVVKIPDNITNENACTMLCGGITSYAPLKRWGVGPGSIVGVMGIGGLGHFGVLFAKALGARVVAISHNEKKRDVALQLGADEYISTHEKDELKKRAKSFTHILCTGCGQDFKWEDYLPTIKADGVFINVSHPAWNFPEVPLSTFIRNQVAFAGSAAGSPEEAEDMLKLASEKKIEAWVETFPMDKVNDALQGFRDGKPRFRYVLKN